MRTGRTLVTGLALAVVLVGAAATPVAATQTTSPSMTVELRADGDARVTVVSTFDLDNDDERAAFDELRTNETAREAYTARFEDRWRAVAANTAEETGREMTVSDASLELTREGSTGVATFTITWTNLAEATDGTVRLFEPFNSGFEPDRRFVVVLPEEYDLRRASGEPTSRSEQRIVYDADAAFETFGVVADGPSVATETPLSLSRDSPEGEPPTTTGGSGPGFGIAAALAGLLAAALLSRRG